MHQFAAKVGLSKASLMMVETGNFVPDQDVLNAYLEFTSTLRPTERVLIRRLWEQARREATRDKDNNELQADVVATLAHLNRRDTASLSSARLAASQPDVGHDVDLIITKPAWRRSVTKSQADSKLWPAPDTITTVKEFTAALRAIKLSTGLSFEALATASKRLSYPLARSTVHSLCSKEKLPSTPKAVACFIEICGGTRTDIVEWTQAWQRLAQQRPTTRDASQDAREQHLVDTDAPDNDNDEPPSAAPVDAAVDADVLWVWSSSELAEGIAEHEFEPVVDSPLIRLVAHPARAKKSGDVSTTLLLLSILCTAIVLFVASAVVLIW